MHQACTYCYFSRIESSPMLSINWGKRVSRGKKRDHTQDRRSNSFLSCPALLQECIQAFLIGGGSLKLVFTKRRIFFFPYSPHFLGCWQICLNEWISKYFTLSSKWRFGSFGVRQEVEKHHRSEGTGGGEGVGAGILQSLICTHHFGVQSLFFFRRWARWVRKARALLDKRLGGLNVRMRQNPSLPDVNKAFDFPPRS